MWGCLAKVPASLPKKIKTVENAFIIVVCLYVDYMLTLGANIKVIKSTKRILSNNFNMKDLGVADIILGIKIIKTSDGISYLTHIRGQDDKKIQVTGDQREYRSFSPTHIPSQEYRN